MYSDSEAERAELSSEKRTIILGHGQRSEEPSHAKCTYRLPYHVTTHMGNRDLHLQGTGTYPYRTHTSYGV